MCDTLITEQIRAGYNIFPINQQTKIIFETYVVSEIIKNFYAYNKDPKESLFYYRDIDQKEIDLVYVNAGDIYPIEFIFCNKLFAFRNIISI